MAEMGGSSPGAVGSKAANPAEASPWIIAVSVMFGTFMVILDTTVVNVSLPHIAGSLSATVEEATWALTSYLAANAIILPITGWLANHFGRRKLLMLSVTGFSGASLLCGLAVNLPMLILCRIVQGATGGVMQPLSQAVMLEAFPPQDRGKAMGFWGVGIVVAPILGPVLGGWLTDNYTWRWIFYINIPFGAGALLMIRSFIFDPPYIRRLSSRVDYWGIALLAVGVGGLQVALDKGQQEDWLASNFIAVLLSVAVIAVVVFLVHEWRSPAPVVDLRVFRSRTYATGVFLMTVLGFVLYSSMVLLPILLQTLLGYPSYQAGLAMAPRGLGSLVAMPIVGLLTDKFDPRKLVGLGLLAGAGTLFQLSRLNLNAGYWDFFWPQLLQGVALGLLFVPLTTVAMEEISKEGMGNATSLFNLMRNVGGSVGIATVTTLLARRQQLHIQTLGAQVHPYSSQTQTLLEAAQSAFQARGADAFTSVQQSYAALWGMVQRQAVMLSFLDAFYLLGCVFLVMTPLIWLMKRPARQSPTSAPLE